MNLFLLPHCCRVWSLLPDRFHASRIVRQPSDYLERTDKMRNILKSAVAIGLLASAGVVTAQTTDGAAVTTTDQPNDTSGVVTDPVTGTPSTPTDTTGTIARSEERRAGKDR